MRGVSLRVALLLGATWTWGQGVENGGFERLGDNQAQGWRVYGRPYTLTSTEQHGGRYAIECEATEFGSSGVMQEVVYANPDKTPVIFGGWCKSAGANAEFNSIYLDIWYEGGGNAWGIQAHWGQEPHDWEYTAQIFYPEKPIAKIQYFVFLRSGKGRVWYDDLTLERREPELGVKSLRFYSDYPWRADGGRAVVEWWQKCNWRALHLNSAGVTLGQSEGNGTRFEMDVTGGSGEKLQLLARTNGQEFKESYAIPAMALQRRNPLLNGSAVWVADSMRGITALTFPEVAEMEAAQIDLQLARNESESAQILVTTAPGQALANVTVELSPLRDSTGRAFDGVMEWRRIGYVRRQWPHNQHPLAVPFDEQWLPDPLLPPAPFKVRANSTQGVWLTIHANMTCFAGDYSGTATVLADGQILRVLPVKVHIFDFANPATFGMRTAFAVMDGFTRALYPERFEEMKRKSWDLMLDYRLNPDDISRTEPPAIADLLHARARGMNCFNILNLVHRPARPVKWVCYAPLAVYTPEFYESLKERLIPYVAELRQHGLQKYAYLYGFDERPHEYYPAIGALWRNLKRDFPDIPVMTTAMMYRDMAGGRKYPDQDITDWFCPLSSVYQPELSERLRTAGKEVWWYVCCGPVAPYANFAAVEYPPIEGRIIGWLGKFYHSDGLLFWHVNLWHNEQPLDGSDTFLAQWKVENSNRMPGDGQLLYPGVDGPWPSIRLANVRDGIEDYEWLQLLEKQCGSTSTRELMAGIVRSMTEFERSPAVVRETRLKIARKIESGQREATK